MATRELSLVAPVLHFAQAGEIPTNGHAIKDGFVYAYGVEIGVLMRITYMGITATIYYLQSDKRRGV